FQRYEQPSLGALHHVLFDGLPKIFASALWCARAFRRPGTHLRAPRARDDPASLVRWAGKESADVLALLRLAAQASRSDRWNRIDLPIFTAGGAPPSVRSRSISRDDTPR